MRFYAAQSVPEPSSLGLLALGACGGLIVLFRRHRVGHPRLAVKVQRLFHKPGLT